MRDQVEEAAVVLHTRSTTMLEEAGLRGLPAAAMTPARVATVQQHPQTVCRIDRKTRVTLTLAMPPTNCSPRRRCSLWLLAVGVGAPFGLERRRFRHPRQPNLLALRPRLAQQQVASCPTPLAAPAWALRESPPPSPPPVRHLRAARLKAVVLRPLPPLTLPQRLPPPLALRLPVRAAALLQQGLPRHPQQGPHLPPR